MPGPLAALNYASPMSVRKETYVKDSGVFWQRGGATQCRWIKEVEQWRRRRRWGTCDPRLPPLLLSLSPSTLDSTSAPASLRRPPPPPLQGFFPFCLIISSLLFRPSLRLHQPLPPSLKGSTCSPQFSSTIRCRRLGISPIFISLKIKNSRVCSCLSAGPKGRGDACGVPAKKWRAA